jgi:hypothetical protein
METETEFNDPLHEALIKWINTFQNEIGEDALIDYFP